MLAGTLKRNRFQKETAETTGHGHMTDLQQDIALLQRIAAKDEAALRELYAAYGQRLYAYALRLTNSPATAEDIVQDTLVIVCQSAGRFRGEGRVLTWLLGIVHHTAMKALRHVSQPISDEMEKSLPAPVDSPEERIQTKEQSQWVRRGLQSLSPEHRAVLELVFYQGLSLNEVAEVCDCPVGTVKSRLSYARKHLRGILSRQEEA
jgi:RNA polymerase sigma-70 factor (ECF subfamily)